MNVLFADSIQHEVNWAKAAEYEVVRGSLRTYILRMQILQWAKAREQWPDGFLQSKFAKDLNTHFAQYKGRAYVFSAGRGEYCALILMNQSDMTQTESRAAIERFAMEFSERNAFRAAVFVEAQPSAGAAADIIKSMHSRIPKPDKQYLYREDGFVNSENGNGEIISTAIGYIRQNLHLRITRNNVSQYVHLNPEYFSRLFHKEVGCTFKEYVLKEKMKYAADMLASTSLPVGTVAGKIGFENFSHFSHTFRKYYEQTPQEYRQNNANKRG